MKESTRDKIGGKATEAKGKVKEKAGRVTGNPNLEDEGRAEKVAGKVRSKIGDIKKVFDK